MRFPPLILFLLTGLSLVLSETKVLAVPGYVDTSFDAKLDGTVVSSVAVQSDHRILIGGQFHTSGVPTRSNLVRLLREGVVDTTFDPQSELLEAGILVRSVTLIKIQPDEKILVVGDFRLLNGESKSLIRLNSGGALDSSFDASVAGQIRTVACHENGSIWIGGAFRLDGISEQRNLARLNADGSPNSSFDTEIDGTVSSIVFQDDDKLLVGGAFSTVGGTPAPYLCRLNGDGTRDGSFAPALNGAISAIIQQPDGRIFIGGSFSGSSGQSSRVRRLLPDGSDDPTFLASIGGTIFHMGLLANGRIVIAGEFTMVNGKVGAGLVRLLPSGETDPTFPVSSGSNRRVNGSLAIQADGGILVSGDFNSFTAASGKLLARVDNGTSSSSLERVSPETIRWERSNSAPEVGRVDFEIYEQAGSRWIGLGKGVWTAAGWEISHPSLPADGLVRAIGKSKVSYNGDGSLESMLDLGSVERQFQLTSPDGQVLQKGDRYNFNGTLSGYKFDQTFHLKNTGAGVLRNLAVSLLGSNKFSLPGNSPTELAPGATMPIVVRFSPTYQGIDQVSLRVASNALDSPFSVTLTSSVSNVFSCHFNSVGDLPLTTNGFTATGISFGTLSLGFKPQEGDVLTAVNNIGNGPITGTFSNLPEKSLITAVYDGEVFTFLVGYGGNKGNALTFTLVGPGVIRPQFAASINSINNITAIAKRLEGGIVVGGDVNIHQGTHRQQYLALLDDDGNYVPSFNPVFWANGNNCRIDSIVACPDGKLLIGGYFLTVNGLNREGLVRLNQDGSIDQGFDAKLSGDVQAIALQRDGRIVVVGSFTKVGEVSQARIARLEDDGSLDTSFVPIVDGGISCVASLGEGKILIAGNFGSVNGVTRERVARLVANGDVDPDFEPQGWTATSINSILPAPDGGVFLAGQLSAPDAKGLLKLTPNGSIDGGFRSLAASGTVKRIALQQDGKLLVGGLSTGLTGLQRWGAARLMPDGMVDRTFAAMISGGEIYSLLVGEDGEVLVGGEFNAVNGIYKQGIARLANTPTSASLDVTPLSVVRWVQTGPGPEYSRVSFEQYSPSLQSWIFLGDAVRASDGWQLEGDTMPAGGVIRAKLQTLGDGRSSFSSEVVTQYGSALPRTVVENSLGEILIPGVGSQDFGKGLVGHQVQKTLRISNAGDGYLENLTAGLSGEHAAEFRIVGHPPTSLLPGQSADIAVQFSASAAEGPRTATLAISSNDPGEPSYEIVITGAGTTVFDPVFESGDSVPLRGETINLNGKLFGTLELGFVPQFNTRLIAIENTGAGSITGRFDNLPDGSLISAVFNGVTYEFRVGYAGGTGNDLVFTLVNGPGLDLAFNPVVQGTDISVCILEEGGGLVVGGAFTHSFGVDRRYLARLHAGGTLDPTFHPRVNGKVWTLHRLPSGGYLIGGDFNAVGDHPVAKLAKLDASGNVDPLFTVSVEGSVYASSIQQDGKVVIGGNFFAINGVPRNRIARLNQDGTLDPDFNPGASAAVLCITPQSDGRVLIGGDFTAIAGVSRNGIARLESDGSLDPSFGANLSSGSVSVIHVQPDGAIFLGGTFSEINSLPRSSLAKVDASGTLDSSFLAEVSGTVMNINQQADGKLLIGGSFSSVNGASASCFARLGVDGTLDETLTPQITGGYLSTMILDEEGGIVIGGSFAAIDGISRPKLARLENHPAISSFEINADSSIRLLRGGSSSEAVRASFEIRNLGEMNWTPLGEASRIPGGWELENLVLNPSVMVRATLSMVNKNTSYHQVVMSPPFGDVSPLPLVLDVGGSMLASPPQPIEFGGLPDDLVRSVFLRVVNVGLSDLEPVSLSITGPANADFSASLISAGPLPPLASSLVRIDFTPKAIGNRVAELHVTGGLDSSFSLSIPLRGEGSTEFSPLFSDPREVQISQPRFDATGIMFGSLSLGFSPEPGMVLTLVEVTGDDPIEGRFANLPDGGRIVTVFNEISYEFIIGYHGGTGNDIVIALAGPGTVDPGFQAPPSVTVNSTAAQRDGKILVGGYHSEFGSGVFRVNTDGSLDSSFRRVQVSALESIVVLEDDTILIGGKFVTVNGVRRTGLAKLRQDGTLLEEFDAKIGGDVYRVLPLADGRILVGGAFRSVAGFTRMSLVMLNSDGSMATNFAANTATDGACYVYAISQQQDGKFLIGGSFSYMMGVTRNHIIRLTETGEVDYAFNPSLERSYGIDAGISSMLIQPDGKIVIGGRFLEVAGVPRQRMARLNPDGTLDSTFTGNANDAVVCLAMQADGKLLMSGLFTLVDGKTRRGVARLNPNGSVDDTFVTDVGHATHLLRVLSCSILNDGGIIVGGNFDRVNGVATTGVTKLASDPVESSLEIGEDVRWLAGGSAPELQSARLELSRDGGQTWSVIGAGSRVSDGWLFSDVNLVGQGFVRASGLGLTSNRGFAMIQQIQVFGRELSALEEWRLVQFGFPTNEGEAADASNPDSDGISNLMEFALGLNPRGDSSESLPVWVPTGGGFEMAFDKPVDVSGITYSAEWSTTMREDDWHPAEDLSVGDQKSFRVPVGAEERKFFRLRVTNP